MNLVNEIKIVWRNKHFCDWIYMKCNIYIYIYIILVKSWRHDIQSTDTQIKNIWQKGVLALLTVLFNFLLYVMLSVIVLNVIALNVAAPR